jgi:hypothetical protein
MSFSRPSICLTFCTALIAAFVLAGCGRQSSTQALDSALKQAGMHRESVCPLAGTITIDGLSPQFQKQADRLVVVLHDPDKLDTPVFQKVHVNATGTGEFAFTTYEKDDGVKPGKYIITFSVLERRGKRGLLGPDKLKNLYNDPEKNEKLGPPFVIDHQAPGKSDYAFNLELAGKEAATAGPHAVTELVDKGMK